ncbi:hypothetical protein KC335_g19497, partial [Hortaea werneckii]
LRAQRKGAEALDFPIWVASKKSGQATSSVSTTPDKPSIEGRVVAFPLSGAVQATTEEQP